MNEWKKLSLKDKLEVMEAICTILITVMALWGTIKAFESGIVHKISHIIEYSHNKIVAEEEKLRKKD